MEINSLISNIDNQQPSTYLKIDLINQILLFTMGIIYLIRSPNMKGYVGQTTKTFEERMAGHKSAAGNKNKTDGCRALNSAIRKYGWENMTKEVIILCNDEMLDQYEVIFVKKFDTLSPNGYNLTTGGDSKKEYSQDTIDKMKESAQQRDSTAYRKLDATKDWPKYLGIFEGVVRITKHPKCSCMYFNDKNKTFEQNVEDAKEFLYLLNNDMISVVIRKSPYPKGLTEIKGGYRVRMRLADGRLTTPVFTNQKISLEERLQEALKFIKDNS